VRVAAAKALVAEPPALEALSEHALKDSWPMVRAASVERLTGAKAAEQVLERAVVDRAHQVRAAAIRALAIAGSRAAWPVVDARLEDPDEFPEVVAEAVQFARTLCVAQASPALLGLMRKGLKPDAPASDVDTSMLAFEALTQLGGTAAQSALALTKGAMVPSAFRTAAQLSLRHPPTCVPAASKP
jgi:HEAT repeat protein